jgi:hypothetical protein
MLIQFAFISDLTSNKARVGVSKSYFSLFEKDFWHSCVLILSRLEILVSSQYSQLWVRFCSVLPLFQTMLLYHSSLSTISVLKHVWQPTLKEIGLSKWKFGREVRKWGKSNSKTPENGWVYADWFHYKHEWHSCHHARYSGISISQSQWQQANLQSLQGKQTRRRQ